MITPDSVHYLKPAEVDDPPTQHLVSTATDVSDPHPGRTLKQAENVVLHQIQEWHANETRPLQMAYALMTVDLGRVLNYCGFMELAFDYRPEFTTEEANVWTAQLTQYLTRYGYTEERKVA